MEITSPRPEDVQDIATVFREAWLQTYPNEEYGITHEDIEQYVSDWHNPERLEKMKTTHAEALEDPNRFIKVARIDGMVVGICSGYIIDELTHLKTIYVLPSMQGKGVGSALLKEFLAWVPADKPVRLHVVVYNKQAIGFYKHFGFKETGKRFTEERFTMPSGAQFPELEMMLERQ